MIGDIWTVLQKETKELLALRRGYCVHALVACGVVAIFGIILPLLRGPGWLALPLFLLLWAWAPMLLVTGVMPDLFVGERERHTLEILLASRLPDWAILFGKVGAAIVFGWSVVLISLGMSLATLRLGHPDGQPVMSAPSSLFTIASVSLLTAILAAAVGAHISLQVATVRQARWLMYTIMFTVLLVILFMERWGLNALSMMARLTPINPLATDGAPLFPIVILGLFLADLALFTAAALRFQRTRLILGR